MNTAYQPSPEILTALQNSMDTDVIEAVPWPDQPDKAAYYGLAGQIVQAIEPFTEADNVAVLMSLLVAFGNSIGRGSRFEVSGTRHGMNLFAALTGPTAGGRKGTSWGYIEKLFTIVDDVWSTDRVTGGLSSGEGLIWGVRDEITKTVPKKMDGQIVDYQEQVEDPGVKDKRLLILETELGQTLQVLRREGNTLSAVLRQVWDGKEIIQTLTKSSKAKTTRSHISILAHVTAEELTRNFAEIELLNGLGNRFLWACVRRSKYLPDAPIMPESTLEILAQELGEVVNFASMGPLMGRDDETAEAWRKVYSLLSNGRQGPAGAATARAEAQVMRLACIYALLDQSDTVRLPHLDAALALWDYCERSAVYIFGGGVGDAMAEKILQYLVNGPRTQSDISKECFKGHKNSKQIKATLEKLSAVGKILCRKKGTTGRTALEWYIPA